MSSPEQTVVAQIDKVTSAMRNTRNGPAEKYTIHANVNGVAGKFQSWENGVALQAHSLIGQLAQISYTVRPSNDPQYPPDYNIASIAPHGAAVPGAPQGPAPATPASSPFQPPQGAAQAPAQTFPPAGPPVAQTPFAGAPAQIGQDVQAQLTQLEQTDAAKQARFDERDRKIAARSSRAAAVNAAATILAHNKVSVEYRGDETAPSGDPISMPEVVALASQIEAWILVAADVDQGAVADDDIPF